MKQITVKNPKRILKKENKKKLANKMLTDRERRLGISKFDSIAWFQRRMGRKQKEISKRKK